MSMEHTHLYYLKFQLKKSRKIELINYDIFLNWWLSIREIKKKKTCQKMELIPPSNHFTSETTLLQSVLKSNQYLYIYSEYKSLFM